MHLNDQVCSLKLAKRLKELGVKQSSQFYFVYALYMGDKPIENGITMIVHLSQLESISAECYSAFTSSELGEILPAVIQGTTAASSDLRLEAVKNFSNQWMLAYVNNPNLPPKILFIETTEAEARAKMLIFLIENNYIDLKKEK